MHEEWVVFDCLITAVLGTYPTKAEAEQAAARNGRGSFVFEATLDQASQLVASASGA